MYSAEENEDNNSTSDADQETYSSMYVDLVGAINMSMTLPTDRLVSIINAFTYEMSCVIQSHKGYVLKSVIK